MPLRLTVCGAARDAFPKSRELQGRFDVLAGSTLAPEARAACFPRGSARGCRRARPISNSCSRVIPYLDVPFENERAPSTWRRFRVGAGGHATGVQPSENRQKSSFANQDLNDTPFESWDAGLLNDIKTRLRSTILLQRRAPASAVVIPENTKVIRLRHWRCRSVAGDA